MLTTLGIPPGRPVLPAKRARLYAPMVRFAMKPPPLALHQQTRNPGTRRALEGRLLLGITGWVAVTAGSSPSAPKSDGSSAPRNLRSICHSCSMHQPVEIRERSCPPSTLGFQQKLDGFACDNDTPGKRSGYRRWHRTAIPKVQTVKMLTREIL